MRETSQALRMLSIPTGKNTWKRLYTNLKWKENRVEIANNLLRQAGYYEKRKVDISNLVKMYEYYRYHYNSNQESFMMKYAGLEIHYNHPIWNQDMVVRLFNTVVI